MEWVRDTGYDLADDHAGYPVAVLDDGADTAAHSAMHTAAIQDRVIGWRAGCGCGWRGTQFWPRTQFPSASGIAPDEVDGSETGGGVYAEWAAHLHAVLPGLAVHEAAHRLAQARDELDRAVRAARRAGASWAVIGSAAGLTRQSAHERWGARTTNYHDPAGDSPAADPATDSAATTTRRP